LCGVADIAVIFQEKKRKTKESGKGGGEKKGDVITERRIVGALCAGR
jgi:hypothetical protein